MARITINDIQMLQKTFLKQKNTLEPRIEELRSFMFAFSEDRTIFNGESAIAMRKYLQEIHGEILYAFFSVFVQIEEGFQRYIEAFQQEVDEHSNAIYEVEHIGEVKEEVDRITYACSELHEDVNIFVKEYAQFLNSGAPEDDTLQTALGEASRFLFKLVDNVECFNTHMSPCFYDAKVLLNGINQACKTNITVGASGVDLEYPENYLDSTEWFVDFTQCTIEQLCDVDISYLSPRQQYLYYKEIASKIVATSNIDEYKLLKKSFYDKDYAKYLIEDKRKLSDILSVIEYELFMNSEDLNKINTFMKPLETQDEIGIKVLVYSADEPYRSLFIEYLDEFVIADTTVSGAFNSSANTLVFNAVKDRINDRGAYYTFFHEIGHAIDCYYGKENGYGGSTSNTFEGSNGLTLSDANRFDVQTKIEEEIDDLLDNHIVFNAWSDEAKDNAKTAVVDNLMKYNLDKHTLSTNELLLQDKVKSKIKLELGGADNESASDIFGGVTNNEIVGLYGHRKLDDDNSTYWLFSDGTVECLTNSESFAHYYGRCMTQDPERTMGLNSIATLLPESEKILIEIITEMGDVIQ